MGSETQMNGGTSEISEISDVECKGKKKRTIQSPQLYKRMSAASVRSIPCFYFNCNYSYKRPGSTIVEISDRPLILSDKFDGFIIRSCKKHHDRWKSMELPINSNNYNNNICEICRGLNCIDESRYTIEYYNNDQSNKFLLCRPCAERQTKCLGLIDVEQTLSPSDLPPDDRRMKKMLKKKRKLAKSKIESSSENSSPTFQVNEIQLEYNTRCKYFYNLPVTSLLINIKK